MFPDNTNGYREHVKALLIFSEHHSDEVDLRIKISVSIVSFSAGQH
jgi:hypothetical protein